MKRKITAALIAGAMALSVFSGCSKKDDEDTVNSDSKWYNITKADPMEFYDSPEIVFDSLFSRVIGTTSDKAVILTDTTRDMEVDTSGDDYRNQDYHRSYLDLYSLSGEYLHTVGLDDYIDIDDRSYYVEDVTLDGDIATLSIYSYLNQGENISDDRYYKLDIDLTTLGAGELTETDSNDVTEWATLDSKIPDGSYEGRWTVGDCYIDRYYMYSDNNHPSYVLLVTDAEGDETRLDLRTLLPDTDIWDMSEYIPVDDDHILICPATNENTVISLDLTDMELTDATEEYSWIETGFYNSTYIDGKGLFYIDNVYMGGKTTLQKIDLEAQEIVDYIDFSCSNVNPMDVSDMSIINVFEGGAILAGSKHTRDANINPICVYTFTEAESNPNSGKTILKAASLNGYNYAIYESISKFNETNDEYFIKIDDRYNLETNMDWENMEGDGTSSYLNKASDLGDQLTVDLMAGDGPDILFNAYSLPQLNSSEYLIDLSGKVGDESAYFTNIFDAMRVDGALYQVPLMFTPTGITTYDEYVDNGMNGFTFDQYLRFVDEVCNGKDPINETTQLDYFMLCYYAMAELFRTENGVNYNNDAFRELAQYVNDHVADRVEPLEDDQGTEVWIDMGGAVYPVTGPSGEEDANASYGGMYSISDFINKYAGRADQIRLLGIPSSDGRGPMFQVIMSVGISAVSPNLDGCSQYLELLLGEDMQRTAAIDMWGTPVNMNVFDQMAREQLDSHNFMAEHMTEYFNEAEIRRYGINTEILDESVTDYYKSVLMSCDRAYIEDAYVSVIIREEMQAYFAGQKDLDSVIDTMTNRVSTYLNERG